MKAKAQGALIVNLCYLLKTEIIRKGQLPIWPSRCLPLITPQPKYSKILFIPLFIKFAKCGTYQGTLKGYHRFILKCMGKQSCIYNL